MSSHIKNITICEHCLYSTECEILNPYRCHGRFVPAPDSNFGVTAKDIKLEQDLLMAVD
jgi:hypothetical protein